MNNEIKRIKELSGLNDNTQKINEDREIKRLVMKIKNVASKIEKESHNMKTFNVTSLEGCLVSLNDSYSKILSNNK